MELSDNIRRLIERLIIVIMLACAGYIIYYYWNTQELVDLRNLPMLLISAIMLYIVCQLAKRFLFKTMGWYDWLYYVGLISILMPLLLKQETGSWLHLITDYGSLFLLVPPIFGGRAILDKQNNGN